MANQIKRRNVSSLTYENFPGGHQSQYCSHPCTLNSTPRSMTGCKTPSSAFTRRPDEIGADGFSSKSWLERFSGEEGGGGGGL
ncbi:BTB/POZ domain-containing protein-like [Dorcoceras hygrometricum]|uniref:BTB/POZ domain-containing protein-like n=1 Tax=Dorcoceras hygrometricum TaxID=472368 RepID=A0A2Z7DDI1_9LAMI|nr:BTB/POZ domain-containing protein-like [Dorcoceras hygrometricum]